MNANKPPKAAAALIMAHPDNGTVRCGERIRELICSGVLPRI